MSPASWHHLPLEVKIMVMNQTSDFKSLSSLVSIEPSLTPFFVESSNVVLPVILSRSFPRRMQCLLLDHLLLQQAGKCSDEQYSDTRLFEMSPHEVQTWPAVSGKDPLSVLRHIVQTQNNIEYFAWTFVASRCQPLRPPAESTKEAPPTPSELTRIYQALWLFHVCCDLYQSWVRPRDADLPYDECCSRIEQLGNYLKGFPTWELQELECLYDHLAALLERPSDHPELDAEGERFDPFAIPQQSLDTPSKYQTERALRGAKAKILSRGLSFLHNFIRQSDIIARRTELQRFIRFSDKFIIPTLSELWFENRFSSADSSSGPAYAFRVYSYRGTKRHANTFGTPNAGWRFFLPYHRVPDCYRTFFQEGSTRNQSWSSHLWQFNMAKRNYLGYLREFGFCIWDADRLERWGVLCSEYSSITEFELGRILRGFEKQLLLQV